MESFVEEQAALSNLPAAGQPLSPNLDRILGQIADSNQTPHPWSSLLPLLHLKIGYVVARLEFPVENQPGDDARIHNLLEQLHQGLDGFSSFPFTIQRLCELLLVLPPVQKTRLKYVKAIEKMTSVTGVEDITVDVAQLRGKRERPPAPPAPPPPHPSAVIVSPHKIISPSAAAVAATIPEEHPREHHSPPEKRKSQVDDDMPQKRQKLDSEPRPHEIGPKGQPSNGEQRAATAAGVENGTTGPNGTHHHAGNDSVQHHDTHQSSGGNGTKDPASATQS